jgi:MYXO-CTERM domain-containing protein
MKNLIVAAAVGLVAVGASAQGQFNFTNFSPPGVDAPIFDSNGSTKLAGAAWYVQAYVGADAASLAPVGTAVNFLEADGAGYFFGGAVSTSFAGGTSVQVQVKAWEAAKGTSYEAAKAAGGKYGSSELVSVKVATAPDLPPDLVGLQSFSVVPEPSVMALGVLGAAALLLRRRS